MNEFNMFHVARINRMIKFIKRTAYVTVQTGSSLTCLNHNSTHVSSICHLPNNF